jgi:hypothetical protein
MRYTYAAHLILVYVGLNAIKMTLISLLLQAPVVMFWEKFCSSWYKGSSRPKIMADSLKFFLRPVASIRVKFPTLRNPYLLPSAGTYVNYHYYYTYHSTILIMLQKLQSYPSIFNCKYNYFRPTQVQIAILQHWIVTIYLSFFLISVFIFICTIKSHPSNALFHRLLASNLN